jgi:hypothetical protein
MVLAVSWTPPFLATLAIWKLIACWKDGKNSLHAIGGWQ